MIKTHFNLKTIFTTSSTLILASLYNYAAFAAPKTTNGNVSLGSDVNWNLGAPADNDYIIYGGAHTIYANVNGRVISAIDLNGNSPGLFSVNKSLSIGSIGGGGPGTLNFKFTAGSEAVQLMGTGAGAIAANDYTKFTSIDFNGLNSILKISSDNANLATNFYGNRSGTFGEVGGTIEIDANNVTLSGAFEDTLVRRVVNINVNSGNNLILDTDLKLYNELRLEDLAILTVRPGKNLSARNIQSNPSSGLTELSTINFEGNSEVDSFIGLEENGQVGSVNIQGLGSTVRFKKSIVLSRKLSFNGNSQAIFSDGANLLSTYVDGNIPNSGILTFLGDSRVKGGCGLTNGLDTVNINGVGKTVTFEDTLFVNGNINIANGATARFGGNLKATDVRGAAPSSAIVEFINDDENAYYQGDFGTGGKLVSLKISNKSLDVSGNISTDKIEFTNASQVASLKLSGNGQIGATNITTASINRLHNIWVNSDQNVTGDIGTGANPFGTIKILSDKIIKVNTANFYTDVNTAMARTGKVEFIKENSFSYSLGDAGEYLSEIKFTENAEVRGSAYAEAIIIPTGKTAKFKKRTRVSDGSTIIPYVRTVIGTQLLGPGSTIYFDDLSTIYSDSPLSGNITTTFDGEGKAVFEGNADIRVDMGTSASRLQTIEFAANSLDKTVNLSRDMYAKDISFNNANVVVVSGGIIDGNVIFNSTALNIKQNILIFSGGTANFIGDPAFKIYFDNASNSHITIKGNEGNVKLSGVNSMTFDITDASSLPPKAGRIFNFFRFENGGTLTDIDVSKVIIRESNPFVTWTYKEGVFLQTKDIQKGLGTIVKAAGGNTGKIPDAFKDVDTDGDSAAARFIKELVAISSNDTARAGEAFDRVINPIDPAHEIMVNNLNNVQSAIFAARINNNEQFKFNLVDATGVAAGDDLSTRFGAWVSPFYSQSVQKGMSGVIGFKSRAGGGSIGADALVNDNLMLGIAGTVFNTKVDYKNQRAGDSSKIDSMLFSIYGLQTLSNNWFIEGIASASTSKIKNSKNRLILKGAQQATSKYTSQSYGTEFKTGYNYNLTNHLVITPNIGLRYNHFTGDKYQEQGTSAQNLGLSKRKYDKIEGLIGLQLAQMIEKQKFKLIPQAHGSVNYNLNQKAPSAKINLEGLSGPITSRSGRSVTALYNIGAGIKAEVGRMEYEVNYDTHLASKYVSHMGSFKIRVNF